MCHKVKGSLFVEIGWVKLNLCYHSSMGLGFQSELNSIKLVEEQTKCPTQGWFIVPLYMAYHFCKRTNAVYCVGVLMYGTVRLLNFTIVQEKDHTLSAWPGRKGWLAVRLAVVPKIGMSLVLLLLWSRRYGYACHYWRPRLGHPRCQTWKSLTTVEIQMGWKSGSQFGTMGSPDLVSSSDMHTLTFQILIVKDRERFLFWALQPVLQPVALYADLLVQQRSWDNKIVKL